MKVGDTVGRYKLLELCGKGAFGEVFLAEGFTKQRVALKIIELDGASAERELRALRDYAQCCPHESLMTIHHADIIDNFYYYTMDLADNFYSSGNVYVADTLEERLDRNGAFTVQKTINLAVQILKGLIVLHGKGLIHRDIKPANILWIRGQAKLGDIGLLAHDNSMTCQAGTPGFMPPPNLGIRNNSPQLDLYALAQVLYCCLTGGQDADSDDLEFSEDLQKNGQRLFQTINLVCQRNSPIKTAEQFLESLQPSSPKKQTVAAETLTPSESSGNNLSVSFNYNDSADGSGADSSRFRVLSKAGLLLSGNKMPGGLLTKGLAAGALLFADKLISDSVERGRRKDLEAYAEELERQNARQQEELERQKSLEADLRHQNELNVQKLRKMYSKKKKDDSSFS